jgi:outer membrane protein OmpA-like peptidoglycan-associated protein
MKLSSVKASLMALALFSAAGMAWADQKVESLMPTAQVADTPQEMTTIRQFLANGKDLSKMKLPRLQQRLHRAETFRQVQGLPPDIAQALDQEIARIAKEISRREQGSAGSQAPVAEAQPPAEPKLEDPPLPPYDPQQAQDGQPAQDGQQPVLKRHKRQPQTETQQPEPPATPAPQQAAPQPEMPASSPAAAAFLTSVRPAAQLSEQELRLQMSQAMELSQAKDLSAEQRSALRDVIREARAALRSKQEEAQQPAPAPQPPVAEQPAQTPPAQQQAQQPPAPPTDKQLANPTVNPALERKAQAYLSDGVDVRTLKRKQLRKRLADIRDLLATNQLSPQTREALRQKLASERAVLRNDVAVDEGLPPPGQQTVPQPPPQPPQQPAGQQPVPQPQPGGGNTTVNNNANVNNTYVDVRVVLNDRRPPSELDDRELVRRIDVYREVVADDRYDAERRMMWRRQMEEDRRYLRRQMMEERQQREARLRQGDYQFDYDVQDRYEPGYDVPDDVFAAEADDSELADVLAAPPRRQVQRRYTLDDIERQPQVREAVARIEIDTVHFGFGEGFLREEEIDKLDRIASVLEKILARHPDEVFLIEGHTDAVGSDAANLVLSRQRAQAVKDALTTYYVIPAGNLKTVGLGERYLKIPTNQPEAENRRVSLARITALVGQAQD